MLALKSEFAQKIFKPGGGGRPAPTLRLVHLCIDIYTMHMHRYIHLCICIDIYTYAHASIYTPMHMHRYIHLCECITKTKHKIDIKTHQKHRYNTIPIFRSIFLPRNYTVVHLFLINSINRFYGNSEIIAIFFTPCMVTDSRQKILVVNMQIRQCFARAKPFKLKKRQILSGFFYFQEKPKAFKKRQNFKIWLEKKPNWQL